MAYQHNGLLTPVFILGIFSLGILEGKMKSFFSWKPFVFLGTISYAVYILQYPIYQICEKHIPFIKDLSDENLFYAYVGVLIMAATATYYLIEKPMRNLLKGKR